MFAIFFCFKKELHQNLNKKLGLTRWKIQLTKVFMFTRIISYPCHVKNWVDHSPTSMLIILNSVCYNLLLFSFRLFLPLQFRFILKKFIYTIFELGVHIQAFTLYHEVKKSFQTK